MTPPKQLTIDHAIERAMRRTDPYDAKAAERDAAAIARVVIKHWGDSAAAVLAHAHDIAKREATK